MSASGGEGLLCGFWGEGQGPAALAWRLAGSQGGLIAEGAGAAVPAQAEIESAADPSLKLRLVTADGGELEAELTPHGEAIPLDAGTAPGGDVRAALCDAVVRAGEAGDAIRCRGFALRWAGAPEAGAQLFRALAVPAPDGGLLVLISRREPGAGDHAAEARVAWRLAAGGEAVPFEEALLSTQYDGEGRQTRAGLELWPADAETPPMRAAATALGLGASNGTTAALMRSSAEGTPGVGGYLIWRS